MSDFLPKNENKRDGAAIRVEYNRQSTVINEIALFVRIFGSNFKTGVIPV